MAIQHPNERQMVRAIERKDVLQQAQLLTNSNPNVSLRALRAYLMAHPDPGLRAHGQRQAGCSSHARCHRRGCPKCTLGSGDKKKDHASRVHQSESRSLSKDPQVAMAQRAAFFHTVPEDEVWFVSINLEAVAPHAVLQRIKKWRPSVRRSFERIAKRFGVVMAMGRFEDDPFLAENMIAEDLSEPAALAVAEPRDILMKLHMHLLVHVPSAGHDSVRDAFVREFGPGKIVNVRGIRHATDHFGVDLEGIDGAARYMSKEHMKLNGLQGVSLCELDDVLKTLLLRKRASTRFDFGLRSCSNPDVRRAGKWVKRCRRDYGLPNEWDHEDVETYLVEEDLSAVVHGYPSWVDTMEDMEEDSQGGTPSSKCTSYSNWLKVLGAEIREKNLVSEHSLGATSCSIRPSWINQRYLGMTSDHPPQFERCR